MLRTAIAALALALTGAAGVFAQAQGQMVVSPNDVFTQQPVKTSINGVTFDMTYADVTNRLGRFRPATPPKSALKTVAYEIFRLSEPRIGIGNARPNVLVGCAQIVFFNQSNEVVAIEMRFDNLDIDKVQHILNKLQDKYESLPSDRAHTYNYQVDPNVHLRSEVIATQYTSDPIGGPRQNMSTVKNTYIHDTKFRAALEATDKAVVIENLL